MSNPTILHIEFDQHPDACKLNQLQEMLNSVFCKIFGKYSFEGKSGAKLKPCGCRKNLDNTVSFIVDYGYELQEHLHPELYHTTTYYSINIANNELINEQFSDDINSIISFFTIASFILIQPNVKNVFLVDEYRTENLPLLNLLDLIRLFEQILLNKQKI